MVALVAKRMLGRRCGRAERVGGILSCRFGWRLGQKRERERESEGWGLGRRWLPSQQIHTTIKLSRLWRWGGRLGGCATGEERAGDSRGVTLAVKLINKKMKE
jgi:hypothetical protein